jgi:hypothetical protein
MPEILLYKCISNVLILYFILCNHLESIDISGRRSHSIFGIVERKRYSIKLEVRKEKIRGEFLRQPYNSSLINVEYCSNNLKFYDEKWEKAQAFFLC